MASRLNSATATIGGSVSTGHGLTAIDRSNMTAVQHYMNGAVSGNVGTATSTAPSSARFVLGQGAGSLAANQFCAIVIGGHLTAEEHARLHLALDIYMRVLGVTEMAMAATSRSYSTAFLLPDGGSGAIAGKGLTCTGLARLPDRSWLVGNDSRGANATDPNLSSIVHLSAGMDVILHQWRWRLSACLHPARRGLAWDPVGTGGIKGRIWFVLSGAKPLVRHITIADDWSPGTPGCDGHCERCEWNSL